MSPWRSTIAPSVEAIDEDDPRGGLRCLTCAATVEFPSGTTLPDWLARCREFFAAHVRCSSKAKEDDR